MIRSLLAFAFRRFGRRYDYDPAYMIEIADANAMAGLKLAIAASLLSHDFDVPKPVYFAAKARSARRADCGPCLRLILSLAAEQGVPAGQLLPVFDSGATSPDAPSALDTALAIAFADAVVDDSPALLEISDQVERRFGKQGRIGLATAVVAGQFFPLYKRALGHAAACEPVMAELLAQIRATDTGHAT